LNVKSAMARDVRPQEIAQLAAKLEAWGGQVQHLLAAFEANMAAAAAARAGEAATRTQVLGQVDAAKKALEKRAGSGGLGGGGDASGGGNFDDFGGGGGRGGGGVRPKRNRDLPRSGGSFPGEGKAVGGRV
jgi:hypothetical protein